MKKYIIINADDFGLSRGTNEAIKKAHKEGILTSASLFATTPGFEDALKAIKECPKLGVGVHLSLTWGKSVLPLSEVPDLVDKDGYFYPSYTRLILKSILKKNFIKQIEKEFCAQIAKVVSTGIIVDHINSQHHVHMIPKIFPVVIKIAQEYKIKFIRIPNERFFFAPFFPEFISPFIDTNFIKFILMKTFSVGKINKSSSMFYGLLYTTKMNQKILKRILSKVEVGVTEIFLHPAEFRLSKSGNLFDFERQKALKFMKDKGREVELKTLLDLALKKLIEKEDIVLTNYRALANIIKL